MKFIGIDIPDELLRAALDDRLIVLAGAGVSMQDPVKLPNFNTLVEQIREEADPHNTVEPRRKVIRKYVDHSGQVIEKADYAETPEHYLGRLEAQGMPVHQACARILGKETRTTDLHRNILRLFGGANHIRLITTNFDRCFEAALDELNLKPPIYEAPALPLGRDFTGVVHLHGSVNAAFNQVLTSADYGAAYLRDAWATRFLIDAFSNYHVLLVGYSCGDVVVDYLTRALAQTNGEHLYVLARASDLIDDADEWGSRGIRPISISTYDDLPELFSQWADFNVMTVYDRAEKTRIIADMPGSVDELSAEFIYAAFRDSDHDRRLACIRVWCETAADPLKLSWAHEQGYLNCLHNDSNDETDQLLRTWAIETYLTQGCTELAQLSQSNTLNNFSSTTYQQILESLVSCRADDRCVAFWLPVLDRATHLNYYRLVSLVERTNNSELKLRLTELIFRLRASMNMGFIMRSTPLAPVNHCQRCHGSPADITNLITDDLPFIGTRLLMFCIQEIEYAYTINQTLLMYHKRDVFTWARRSIGPTEEEYEGHGDTAVDCLIDLIVYLVDELHGAGASLEGFAHICLQSPNSLTLRIGIYIKSLCAPSSQEAVRFVVDNNLLNDPAAKCETFDLLAAHFPKLTGSEQQSFIDYVCDQLWTDGEDQTRSYETFNLFAWLQRYAPDSAPLVNALKKAKSEHPEYLEREYPQYNWYDSTAEWFDDTLPEEMFTLETLRNLYSSDQYHFEFTLQDSTRSHPLKAYREVLLPAADADDAASKTIAELILVSLDWRTVAAAEGLPVIEFLLHELENDELRAHVICALGTLYQRQPIQQTIDSWGEVVRALISSLHWAKDFESSVLSAADQHDWTSQGLNQPAGNVLLTAQEFFRYRIAEHNVREIQLLDQMIKALGDALQSTDDTASGIRAILFAYLPVWFEVSPEKTKELLISLLAKGGMVTESCFDGLSYTRVPQKLWDVLAKPIEEMFAGKSVSCLNSRGIRKLVSLIITFADNKDKPSLLHAIAKQHPEGLDTALLTIEGFATGQEEGALALHWNAWIADSLSALRHISEQANSKVNAVVIRITDEAPSLTTEAVKLLGDGAATLDDQDLFFCKSDTLEAIFATADSEQFTNIACLCMASSSIRDTTTPILNRHLHKRADSLRRDQLLRIRDACAVAGVQNIFNWKKALG